MKLTKKKTRANKKYCSPSNKHKDKFTCFSRPALKRIIQSYNRNNILDSIDYDDRMSRATLWHLIDDKMKSKCKEEWCWIQQSFLDINDRNSLKELFRPKKPKKWDTNPREWLNSLDIENVMKQYEQKHSDFVFIGPVPIDFDHKFSTGNCVTNELCRINVQSLMKKGKKKIGVIFNLDKHYEPGSHWNALFVDVGRKGIYFFDSYASKPTKEVDILMDRLKKQFAKADIKMKIAYNNVRNQWKDSECGVYSLNFLVKMLETNIKFKDFIKTPISDDDMFKKREYFFI